MENSWKRRTTHKHSRHRARRPNGARFRIGLYALLGVLLLCAGLITGASSQRAAQAVERDVLAEGRATAALLPTIHDMHVRRRMEEARYNGMKAERDDLLKRWPTVTFDGFKEEQLAVAWQLHTEGE